MKTHLAPGKFSPSATTKKGKLIAGGRQQFCSEDQAIPYPSEASAGSAHNNMSIDPIYPQALEQAENAAIIVDGDGSIVFFNAAAERLWGHDRKAVLGAHISRLMPLLKDERQPPLKDLSGIGLLVGHRVELPIERPNLTRVWAEISASRIEAASQTHYLLMGRNITLHKVNKTLRYNVLQSMAKTESLQEVMTLLCQEIERIAPEISVTVSHIGKNGRPRMLVAPSFPHAYIQHTNHIEPGPEPCSQELAVFRNESVLVRDIENDPDWKANKRETLELGYKACWMLPIKARDSHPIGILSFFYRVCRSPNKLHAQLAEVATSLCSLAMERDESRARIHHLAFFDDLTDLPNRSLLYIQSNQAIAQASRDNTQLAVLFIDVDRFKQVNDSLGHPTGDALLRIVSDRLRATIREVDILSRYSGDEFIIVLTQCDSVHASDLAGRLLAALSSPCVIGGTPLSPAASIGISLFPENGRDINTLIHAADMAMYQAKQKGRGCFSFFSGQMNQIAKERLALETALREAISGNQLKLFYQPQVNIESHRLHGIEALVRWNDPALGNIPPAQFIPLAEKCGLMNSLSQWVLNEACRQLAQWRQRGLIIPSISVNLSPTDFHNPKLPQYLEAILRSHGLLPGDLLIEITEGVLMDSNSSTLRTLNDINALGVRLSIDDFGTGYSNLGYLRNLPVSELKLDQSFVRDLDRDRSTRALTNAVMHIGDSMNLVVVAEGVEHSTQRNLLKAQGYQIVQGYLFSPPQAPEELENWLEENLSFTLWQ